MLIAIEGTYENGQITLAEQPPLRKKTKVFVTFLDEESKVPSAPPDNVIRFGSMAGKIRIDDDFNDPLADLNEYM